MAAPGKRGVGPGFLLRAIGRLALLVALGFGAGLVIGVAIEEPTLLIGHLRGESESVRLVEAPYADQAETNGAATTGAGREPGANGEQPIGGSALTANASRASQGRVALDRRDADTQGAREAEQRRDPQAERLALRDSESQRSASNPAVAAPATRSQSDPVSRQSDGRVPGDGSGSSPNAIEPGDLSRWAIQVGAFGDERSALGLVDQLTAKRYPVDLIPSSDKKHRWRVRIQPIRGKANAQKIANRLKQEDGLPTWLILLEADAR